MIGKNTDSGSFKVATYFDYDADRNRTAVVDPLGNKTFNIRDGNGPILRL